MGSQGLAPLPLSISDDRLSTQAYLVDPSTVRMTAERILLSGMSSDHLLLAGAKSNDLAQIEAVRVVHRACAHARMHPYMHVCARASRISGSTWARGERTAEATAASTAQCIFVRLSTPFHPHYCCAVALPIVTYAPCHRRLLLVRT